MSCDKKSHDVIYAEMTVTDCSPTDFSIDFLFG